MQFFIGLLFILGTINSLIWSNFYMKNSSDSEKNTISAYLFTFTAVIDDSSFSINFSLSRIYLMMQYHIASLLLSIDYLPYLFMIAILWEGGNILYVRLYIHEQNKSELIMAIFNGFITYYMSAGLSLFIIYSLPDVCSYIWTIGITSLYLGCLIKMSTDNCMFISSLITWIIISCLSLNIETTIIMGLVIGLTWFKSTQKET